MIKELKYGGYSASPNDHETLEGDLAVAMNLVPEHHTIRPVLPPKAIAKIPWDAYLGLGLARKIVCIHRTSAYTNYIVAIQYPNYHGNTSFWYLYTWDGSDSGQLERIGDRSFTQVYKVEPVGNTLVVLTDTGIHYYLWKSGAYKYLGNHLPELDLQFSQRYNSRAHDQDVTFASTTTADLKKDEAKDLMVQAIMAAANGAVKTACESHLFTFPYFVRYALRLYDGSIVHHSAPIFMKCKLDPPSCGLSWHTDDIEFTADLEASCTLSCYKLYFKIVDTEQLGEFNNWKDIITDISFYVSPQFYTYRQDATKRHFGSLKVNPAYLFANRNQNGNNSQGNESGAGIDTITLPKSDTLYNSIVSNGLFFHVSDYKIDRLLDGDVIISDPIAVDVDFETSNEIIVTRPVMTDDYQTHDILKFSDASSSFPYNSRLNLANLQRSLFRGFSPCCLWFNSILPTRGRPSTQNSGTATSIRSDASTRPPGDDYSRPTDDVSKLAQCTVSVSDNGREIVVQSLQRPMYISDDDKIVWFFYPDPNAKFAYFNIDGNMYKIRLQPHDLLNGAYYFGLGEDAVQQSVDSIPTPSTDDERIVDMPNKVYTSEVNNPFFFPAAGINSMGTGNIMGLCAAVRPVSTGQMGYADLYIFADSGVWVAKINEKGTYSNVTLATGDVCINPDSITQMETSVLFTTDRGIMLISGSQAQCISEAIDDNGQQAPGLSEITDLLAPLLDLSVNIKPFREFLGTNKDNGCRMLYDYRGQRIIAYNPSAAFPYAYIYSLESNKWGMMESNIDYSVRAYPEALAVNRNGELVDCSVGDGTAVVSQLLVTRPLTLDQPDVLKTVNTVLQRGLFRKHQGHVQSVLYGSRDLYNWHLVKSSKDEDMRGFSGTPYKWFRVALLLRLPAGESVTGCSIDFDPRYTNRLR
jgi:hypothetical protein